MVVLSKREHLLSSFLNRYQGLQAVMGNIEGVNYQHLSIDSRTLRAGEMFVALRGERHDGHAFIPRAIERGAAAVVAEAAWIEQNRNALEDAGINAVVAVQDTLDFLQQLASWHRRQLDLPLIGITGSNGKTTTREMLAGVLSQRYRVFRSEGNKNNHIGLPLMLLELHEDIEMAVIEIGTNHAGEIAFLAGLTAPTAGLVTNIGKGHIGYFGSLEEVYREKTALFEVLGHSSAIFLNMEDRYLRQFPRKNRRIIRVGLSDRYDVWGKALSTDRYGCPTFTLNNCVDIHLKVPGLHQLSNALLASAAGLHFGITERQIKEALESFSGTKQRMEMFEKNNILFINDAYNANPDSMQAAVDHLASLKVGAGKRILVLGDMLELGAFSEDEHTGLGNYIAGRPIDYVFLYGPQARFIQQAIETHRHTPVRALWYETHQEIASHLQQVLSANDVVLLKGSRGMEMEKVLEKLPGDHDAG